MSVTISNWKQICDAPTNKSCSKMTYSFSKAHRFTNDKENKYFQIDADRIFSTISKVNSVREQLVLAMETNTILQKSINFFYLVSLPVHLPTHMNCPLNFAILQRARVFVSEREGPK